MSGRSLQLPLPLPSSPSADEIDWPFEPAFDTPVLEPLTEKPLPSRARSVEAAQTLAASLSRHIGRPVLLQVTDNRSTMVSFKREERGLSLRLHHMFLDASERLIQAIAEYTMRGDAEAGTLIDRYVRDHATAIRPSGGPRNAAPLRPQGRVHDLQAIFDRLNLTHFDNRIEARIGWGRNSGGSARRRHSIRMGVYDHTTRTIRLHPRLDRPEIPSFFIAYIVFHEMLHQAIPCDSSGARRQHHGPEFRAREKGYPDYERALAWEKANLPMLLGRRSID